MFGKNKKLKEEIELLQKKNKELLNLLAEARNSLTFTKREYSLLLEKFKALQKESAGYAAKLEHINKLNRERQRRYRQNNSDRA